MPHETIVASRRSLTPPSRHAFVIGDTGGDRGGGLGGGVGGGLGGGNGGGSGGVNGGGSEGGDVSGHTHIMTAFAHIPGLDASSNVSKKKVA